MRLRLWVDIAEITASVAVVVTLILLIFQMRESDERERFDLSIEEASVWNRWLFLMWKSLEAEFLTIGPSDDLANRIRLSISYEDQQLVILPAVTSKSPLFHDDFKKYVNSRKAAYLRNRPGAALRGKSITISVNFQIRCNLKSQ